jgi:hypothetical protein
MTPAFCASKAGSLATEERWHQHLGSMKILGDSSKANQLVFAQKRYDVSIGGGSSCGMSMYAAWGVTECKIVHLYIIPECQDARVTHG